jgi:hypothetical protein
MVHRIMRRLRDLGWDECEVEIAEEDDPEDVDEWLKILLQPSALSELGK